MSALRSFYPLFGVAMLLRLRLRRTRPLVLSPKIPAETSAGRRSIRRADDFLFLVSGFSLPPKIPAETSAVRRSHPLVLSPKSQPKHPLSGVAIRWSSPQKSQPKYPLSGVAIRWSSPQKSQPKHPLSGVAMLLRLRLRRTRPLVLSPKIPAETSVVGRSHPWELIPYADRNVRAPFFLSALRSFYPLSGIDGQCPGVGELLISRSQVV